MTFDLASGRDPEPFGIPGARDALARGPEAHPESDLTLLRLELDACHQEITRLRFVLGLVADALRMGDEG